MQLDPYEVTRRFICNNADPDHRGEAFLIARMREEKDGYNLDGAWFEQHTFRPYLRKYEIFVLKVEDIPKWNYLAGDRASAQYGNDFRNAQWRPLSELIAKENAPQQSNDPGT